MKLEKYLKLANSKAGPLQCVKGHTSGFLQKRLDAIDGAISEKHGCFKCFNNLLHLEGTKRQVFVHLWKGSLKNYETIIELPTLKQQKHRRKWNVVK